MSDALYLRDNLLLDGGDHIISKYSRRAPETTVTRKLPKKVRRARTAEQTAAQKTMPPPKALTPRLSPARILQNQGGIEGIIHEAAKGVYNQGERWGVAKALRGAVQGLQSSNNSPRRLPDKSRWSLDSGTNVSESPKELVAKIQHFEERNKSLAKLLEKAVEELWTQQRDTKQQPSETASDALSLAIAKVQFVQVYLENTAMLLPSEDLSADETNHEASLEKDAGLTRLSAAPTMHQVQSDGAADEKSTSEGICTVDILDPSAQRPGPALVKPLLSTPKAGSPSKISGLSPYSQPRPALAQSSFSWMLGDQQKSGFVSVSPSSSGGRRKGDQLFGEDSRNRKSSIPNGNGGDSDDDDDVFTIGNLKSGRRK